MGLITWTILTFVAVGVLDVDGHGMVMNPINRASLWRIDPDAPKDYNDNELYCGGYGEQWNVNGGKCGICGDDYKDKVPRAHENGGTYGTGKIVDTYKQGAVIPVTVKLTTNHKGFFTFDLCKLPTQNALETETCFQNLTLSNGDPKFNLPNRDAGDWNMNVKLPNGVTCDHCVFRWTYTTASMWGYCPDGHGAMGCGPQETYRTCSDIAIKN